MIGANVVEQGEAVGAGHHDVGEDEVVVGVLLETRHCLFCACGEGCRVAAAFEHGGHNAAYGFFIVDYQDSFPRHGFSIGGGVVFVIFFWNVIFVVFAGIFEGVGENAVFFDGEFVVSLWWIVVSLSAGFWCGFFSSFLEDFFVESQNGNWVKMSAPWGR